MLQILYDSGGFLAISYARGVNGSLNNVKKKQKIWLGRASLRYRAPYSANNLIQELVGGASTPGGERVGSQAGLL